MMFLNEQRRASLIEALTGLSMPKHYANMCASYGSDLHKLDRTLANIVGRLSERLNRIRQASLAGDEQARYEHDVFLRCDLCIFETYRDAIVDKGLPARTFPCVNRAIAQSLAEVEQNKQVILKAMGKEGALQ